jgi:predicted nucleic acid binding AN1-type Zn finger protein
MMVSTILITKFALLTKEETMCASSSGRAAAFFSASGAALSQEVTDGKMNVQSACALDTRYFCGQHEGKENFEFHFVTPLLQLYSRQATRETCGERYGDCDSK